MKGDSGIISLAALHSDLFAWALLRHETLLLPMTPPLFDKWVESQVKFGGCSRTDLHSWLAPIDPTGSCALDPNYFREVFRGMSSRYRLTNSMDQTKLVLESMLEIATRESVCMNMLPEEYVLVRKGDERR